MIAEKKKQINDVLERFPEHILDHVLSYIKEIEEQKENEDLDEFVTKLNNKYHRLLNKLAK